MSALLFRCYGHLSDAPATEFAEPSPAARQYCARCEDMVGRVPVVTEYTYRRRLFRTEPRHREPYADAVAAVRDAGPRVPPPPNCGQCGDSPPPGGCSYCGLGRPGVR